MLGKRAALIGASAIALVGVAVPALADDPFGLGLPLPGTADEMPDELRAPWGGPFSGGEIVLSPENNHLNAYRVDTGERYRVVTSAHELPAAGRDINGQICVDPEDPTRFIAGEDTGQDLGDGAADPLQRGSAGWGVFELTDGDDPGTVANGGQGLGARQVGKLVPSYNGKPDNHGCGFLSGDRLVTATIGDIYPGQPGNGELIMWFGDLTAGYHDGYDDGGQHYNIPYADTDAGADGLQSVPYCKLADDIPTAGGIWVDRSDAGNDDIYVASNRPDQDFGEPGGVYRFSGPFPTSPDDCHTIEGELVVGPAVPQALVNPPAVTPSGVVGNAAHHVYVSSVFTGTITEYALDGTAVRPILLPGMTAAGGEAIATPYGMVVDGNGDLWVADLGIVAVEAFPLNGAVVKIPIDDSTGLPGVPVVIDRFLTYPDGLGITEVQF